MEMNCSFQMFKQPRARASTVRLTSRFWRAESSRLSPAFTIPETLLRSHRGLARAAVTKISQAGRLRDKRSSFLRVRCRQLPRLVRTRLLVSSRRLAVASHGKGQGSSGVPFIKALIPLTRSSPPWAPPPDNTTEGARSQHPNSGAQIFRLEYISILLAPPEAG